MLRLVSKITITQIPSVKYPNRDRVFTIDYVHECEIESSWDMLTSTCKLEFPSKAYFKDDCGQKISWFGQNIYRDSVIDPLVFRDDQVKVELGYKYEKFDDRIQSDTEMYTEFIGFITKVSNSVPIVIECQDFMYKLGQMQCPERSWPEKQWTLKQILQEITKGTGLVIDDGGDELRLGNFITGSETIRGMLNSLTRYGLTTYFRLVNGVPTLRCSGKAYNAKDRKEHIIHRQKNVVDDSLDYNRTDDQKVGIKVIGQVQTENGTRRDGSPKIKKQRVEVLVPDGFNKKDGDIRVYHFNTLDKSILRRVGYQQLNKMFYEGFKGTVTLFGMPSVQHGDSINYTNAYVAEQNGNYLIKGVRKRFGQKGYRQVLELDARIDKLQNSSVSL